MEIHAPKFNIVGEICLEDISNIDSFTLVDNHCISCVLELLVMNEDKMCT